MMRSMIAFSLGRQTIISIFGRYKSAPSVFQTAKRQVSKEAKRAARCLITAKCSLTEQKKRERSCQKSHSFFSTVLYQSLTISVVKTTALVRQVRRRPRVYLKTKQQKRPITRSSRSKPKSVSIMRMMIISISIHHNYRQNCKLPIVQFAFAFDGIWQRSKSKLIAKSRTLLYYPVGPKKTQIEVDDKVRR